MNVKYYLKLGLFFVLVNIFIFIFKSYLQANNIDTNVLIIGNLLIFFVCISSLMLQHKAMQTTTNASFTLLVYVSIFGKLLICAIVAFVYIKNATVVSKNAIFILMGVYLVYTILEILGILTITKDLKDAKKISTN
jgi:hypothetical protein